jgi:Domain of unknown function (DUF4177)
MQPTENQPPPLPRSIMTWKYKIHSYKQVSLSSLFQSVSGIPAEEIATALNQLGKDGWEAVGVFPIVMAGSTHTVGILPKRPCG